MSSAQYAFFNHWSEVAQKDEVNSRAYINAQKDNNDYQASLKQCDSLEFDVNSFYTLYKQNKEYFEREENKKHLYYLYIVSYKLRQFYLDYDKKSKAKIYHGYCVELEHSLGLEQDGVSELQVGESPKERAFNYLGLAQLRAYVSQLNLYRIYWVFCRLTVETSLGLLKNAKLLEKLDNFFKTKLRLSGWINQDIDRINKIIDAPLTGIFVLSVVYYAIRFAIDAAMLIKHVFFPKENAKDSTHWQRFKYEMNYRGLDFVNNLVWGVINFITNFYYLVKISATNANYIVAGFLAFDIGLLLVRLAKAKYESNSKKEKLQNELCAIRQQIANDQHNKDLLLRQQILQQQIKQLDDEWKVTKSVYLFNMLGAILLFAGFTACLFAPGIGALACFLISVLGCTIYASDGAWEKFKQSQVALDRVMLENGSNEDIRLAKKLRNQQFKQLSFELLQNAVMPSLIILAFAISWQIAIGLTVLFIAFKIGSHFYKKYQAKKKGPGPGLFAYKLKEEQDVDLNDEDELNDDESVTLIQ